jgi:hypothetical protein
VCLDFALVIPATEAKTRSADSDMRRLACDVQFAPMLLKPLPFAEVGALLLPLIPANPMRFPIELKTRSPCLDSVCFFFIFAARNLTLYSGLACSRLSNQFPHRHLLI